MAGTTATPETPVSPQVIRQALEYLTEKYGAANTRIAMLVLASIFLDGWDLYAISFILPLISAEFHPSAALLGLLAAVSQGGAVIGAWLGGYFTDRYGRRSVFMVTMAIFFVLGLAQAFVTNMTQLMIIRFFLGFPLGADVANGFAYVLEYLPRGRRDQWANRWALAFAIGEFVTVGVTVVFLAAGLPHPLIWRLMLGLGAVPPIIIFLLRYNLPETAAWLIEHGRLVDAKAMCKRIYGDSLDMLPNVNVPAPRRTLAGYFREIRKHPVSWRGNLYGWVMIFVSNQEFATLGFYLPVLLTMLKVSGILGSDLWTAVTYLFAVLGSWIAPQLLPKIGQRKVSQYGFGMVLLAFLLAAWAIFTKHLIFLPIAAALLQFGHNFDNNNVVTIPAVVTPVAYRGVAAGFTYGIGKAALFLGIFVFPAVFAAIGSGYATLLIALAPIIGLVMATWVMPETFGFAQREGTLDEVTGVAP